MTRNSHFVQLKLDPEIERIFHILRRITSKSEQEKIKNMANKSLKELAAPNLNHQPLCIDYPDLDASFKLRSSLIHLLPTFCGLAGEDPHKHLKEFHVVYSSMKSQGISKEQIKL